MRCRVSKVARAAIWNIYSRADWNNDEKRQAIESAYVQAIQLAKGRTDQMRAMEAQ